MGWLNISKALRERRKFKQEDDKANRMARVPRSLMSLSTPILQGYAIRTLQTKSESEKRMYGSFLTRGLEDEMNYTQT